MAEYVWSYASVNGALHWLVYKRIGDLDYCNKILVLDVGTEIFTHMDLPSELVSAYPFNLSIVENGDTIAIIWYRNRASGVNCERCVVWVMGEYGDASSWREKFTVDIEGGISAALGFGPNGEFYLEKFDGYLVCYDPKKDEVTNLGILGGKDSFQVVKYEESFALMDRGVADNVEVEVDDNENEVVHSIKKMMEMRIVGDGPPPKGISSGKQFDLVKHSKLHYTFSEFFLQASQ